MSTPSGVKGRWWENKVAEYMREDGGYAAADRLKDNGRRLDRGDIRGVPGVCIEAKNVKSFDLSGWANERDAETINAGADYGVLVVKRPRKPSPKDAYWILDGDTMLRLLRAAGK